MISSVDCFTSQTQVLIAVVRGFFRRVSGKAVVSFNSIQHEKVHSVSLERVSYLCVRPCIVVGHLLRNYFMDFIVIFIADESYRKQVSFIVGNNFDN